jgi:hypothetical protein
MRIHVVFLGGFLASQPDVDQWKTSAAQQRSDVTFDACPYPANAGASRQNAVDGFESQFDVVLKRIDAVGADALFIVGHSSGCAIANELNSRFKGDHSHTTLVDLDGFAPFDIQIKKSSVQAWSAEGSKGGTSYNWAKGHKIFVSASATQEWSLHFSLVNTAATDAITKDNYYKGKAYAGCIANLCWLPAKTP